ncbi:efflux RND transporter periplasmic adaptor subunit [Chelativorans sp. ZYF759]|uniref:efflux RND transporter periplasmic adaptor subunit n=1 Tax=Chelativorans sp. ZYF759 TaxID=2692213 RepID=UPI00145EE75E|nr:efflux RND transporter periplasmic adaptor subunit [Chelativorans sp. ZYF759]NMG39608.1 efflux RND transporter periplasmic adaptor subunit [Chelativorans sp. ZYF759]
MGRYFNATTLVFLGLIALVVVWIGSGMITREPIAPPERAQTRMPTVAASWSEAEEIVRELVLYGDVEPVQVAMLRARTDGIVEEVVSQGTRVESGDVLAQLSSDDREARLVRAEAQLALAERDFRAAEQLAERGVGPEAEAQARLAQLEAARAELRAIELEIGNTTLRAPISGTVNQIVAEMGAYVSPGGEVLEIVDNDPLVAVVHVQQAQIPNVRVGASARVKFIGGDQKEGRVRFVSPIADAATRTFRVEIQIDNADRELPAGLSAEVTIPFQSVPAHRVSAALGRLDEQGRIGLHILDEEDRIQFAPIEIIRARADGVWVTGLPERARIVTISQGTLRPGQQVNVQETPEEYLLGGAGSGASDAMQAVSDRIGADDSVAEEVEENGLENR